MPKKPTQPETVDADTAQKVVDLAIALAKAKKPRTESPLTVATRAFRERQALYEQRSREITRHAQRVQEIEVHILEHDEKCKALSPEALAIF